ncbi:hypothetical protein Mal4_06160 [Maioricimonas rarisocia]|uniref:Uncharacterized protein n=1 Tax=Maioricimonas rarisocia TaxID=2528026 RepID=A0A517Z1H3_9PLAN|nr:hypothetical protein Mal4_06160 [Maioricimonas rarisocia]
MRWVAGVGTSGASGAPGTDVPQDGVYFHRRHRDTENAGSLQRRLMPAARSTRAGRMESVLRRDLLIPTS